MGERRDLMGGGSQESSDVGKIMEGAGYVGGIRKGFLEEVVFDTGFEGQRRQQWGSGGGNSLNSDTEPEAA